MNPFQKTVPVAIKDYIMIASDEVKAKHDIDDLHQLVSDYCQAILPDFVIPVFQPDEPVAINNHVKFEGWLIGCFLQNGEFYIQLMTDDEYEQERERQRRAKMR